MLSLLVFQRKSCGSRLTKFDLDYEFLKSMVERIFSTFGKSPNLMKNSTDFKEVLFYGLRATV